MASTAHSSLLGRDEEVSALKLRLEEAERAEPSLTLICGEPGVGKSRLVSEVAREAVAGGALVMRGDCLQLSGGEFPYAPVVGALRGLGSAALQEALGRLPADGRNEIGRLVPELAGSDPRTDAQEGPSQFSQGRLFELLHSLLRRLSEPSSLLLVIDDAQWSDASTRDFITYLAHNLATERIAVVVLYRVLRRRDPFAAVVSELTRRPVVFRLSLGRLERRQVEQLVDEALGTDAEQALVDEIFERSGGIPFYAEEVLAAKLAGEDGALAERRDALLLRLDGLEEAPRLVLRALAVLGRPADQTLLGAVAGVPEPELSKALRAGVDERVLERGGDDFDFGHALMREAVVQDLMPGERRRLHAAAAERLSGQAGVNPAELAFHWWGAGQPSAELVARVEAGRAAERLYAFSEAREHFRRAVELVGGTEPSASPSLDRVELLRHEAECARLAGECDSAAQLCRTALDAVDPAAEPLRAAMLLERLGAHTFWGDAAALAAYAEALEILPPGHDRQRARILSATALALHDNCRWEEARERAELALELASGAGSPAAEEAHAHLTLGTALAFLGDPVTGEEHVRRASDIASSHGSVEDRARVFSHLAEVLRLQGRVAAAHDVMRDGALEAARLGMAGSFGNSMFVNAAEDLLWLGRWPEADACLRTTARLPLRDAAQLLHRTVSGQLAVARGDRVAARMHLEAASEACSDETAADYLHPVVAGWAELALWEGRPDDALERVTAALGTLTGPGHPLYTPTLHALGCRAAADAAIVARAGRGEQDRSTLRKATEELIADLERLVARHTGQSPPPQATATLALCRAERLRLLGEESTAAWSEAAAGWKRLDQPYPEAYARFRLGQALLAVDRSRPAATQALGTAKRLAERLGAAPLLQEIDALVRAARLTAEVREAQQPPAPEPSGPPHGLTPRELDVLGLLAEGATDREIAERLFISVRTVGVHVSAIRRKLDVTRRAHAVSTARQLGILDALAARH